MKDWLREHGNSEDSVLRESKGGFQEVAALEMNLECVLTKNGGSLSYRRDASGPMTVAFRSIRSYYVED